MTCDPVTLPGPGATEALGRWLGRHLRPGQAVALVGEMGAGKTTLVRGLARGLGVEDPGAVTSPTYLLVVEHPGPVPLVHVDAWLPAKTRAFLEDGGVDYLLDMKGVVVVEWGDRLADLLPAEQLWVRLTPTGSGDGRTARLEGRPADAFPWLRGMPKMFSDT